MITRPFLRYFGAKYSIADWIIANMPEHRIYVEPFGGGASVLLKKQRSYAEIYNEIDSEITNVFMQMRDNGEELSKKLELTPFARAEFDLAYEHTENRMEAARRTIIRCWFGFGNSAFRECGKTGFQAMVEKTGNSKAAQWKSWLGCLHEFRERLHGVVIESRDYWNVIEAQDTKDTLFFLDPPYVPEIRKSGKYSFEMSCEDHETLCDRIKTVRGMVMLCGYENKIYDKLGWNKLKRQAQGMDNQTKTEVVWYNKTAWDRLPQKNLF